MKTKKSTNPEKPLKPNEVVAKPNTGGPRSVAAASECADNRHFPTDSDATGRVPPVSGEGLAIASNERHSTDLNFLLEQHKRLLELKSIELNVAWQRVLVFISVLCLLFSGYGYAVTTLWNTKGIIVASRFLVPCCFLGMIFSLLWTWLFRATRLWLEKYRMALDSFCFYSWNQNMLGFELNFAYNKFMFITQQNFEKDKRKRSKNMLSSGQAHISTTRLLIVFGLVMVLIWFTLLVFHLSCADYLGYIVKYGLFQHMWLSISKRFNITDGNQHVYVSIIKYLFVCFSCFMVWDFSKWLWCRMYPSVGNYLRLDGFSCTAFGIINSADENNKPARCLTITGAVVFFIKFVFSTGSQNIWLRLLQFITMAILVGLGALLIIANERIVLQKNQSNIVTLYRKAAEQGIAQAQSNLGVCYRKGEGVEKDAAEAVKLYRKAAEQGDADAQFNLGNSYANGEGVEKDAAEAVKWYRKAAEQGDVDARKALKRLGAGE